VPAIQLQLAKGFRPVGIERWLRVCGDSLRRIAATETGWWRREVVTALLASGLAEGEMLQAEADLGSRLAPSPSGPCWPSTTAAGTRLEPGFVEHVEGVLERAGLYRRLERPPAVCFLDMTGYTR
jgi:hypothetical protein